MPPRKRKAEDGSSSSKTKRAKTKASENNTSVPVSVQDGRSTSTTVPPAPPLAVNDFPTEDKAMLSLPPETIDEIMKFYPEIFVGAPKVSNQLPVLSSEYLQRTRALRSLSQVSKAYRNAFLPLLWETINICCCKEDEKSFYKTLGEMMIRYTSGLEESPALKPLIRNANLVFTRYKTSEVLPGFARCLESLPNLRTVHIIHTHSAMTTALKTGFENVMLSNVRRVIGPANCHEILKRCPDVTAVWNTSGDGSTLIGVLKKHCPNVEELRGFYLDESLMTRIKRAVPKLQILDCRGDHEPIINCLPSFKNFHTIILRTAIQKTDSVEQRKETFIKAFKAAFKKLPAISQKRKIRLHLEDESSHWERNGKPPLPSFYQEVEMDE